MSKDQSATSEKISREQAALSLKIDENQMVLSQRQLLIPLWNHMSVLNHINPEKPVEPDVIGPVNTLELVAVSCEGGMVDTQVSRGCFGTRIFSFMKR